MAGEWQPALLRDCVEIKHGFAFQGEFFCDDPPGDILLTPGNFAVGGGFKPDRSKYYRGPVPDEFVLAAGDLLVTMTDLSKGSDTLGFPALVPQADGRSRYLHNQRLGKVTLAAHSPLESSFLYYLLCSRQYRDEVLAGATGTTVKHTSPSRIGGFRFRCPTRYEQRAIAHILGTLDAKIKLNRRMNETLEAMARALFKSWFVDFDPVRAKAEGRDPDLAKPLADLFPNSFEDSELGEIPKGWKLESVYVIAEVIYGAPFASAMFNGEGVGQPLVRIRDLVTETPAVWTPEVHPRAYTLRPGDIVVGMDGEFRAYLWGGPEAFLNQRLCVFAPRPGFSGAFVRNSIIEPLAHLEATEAGTTVIHLGKNDIDRFRVVVPGGPVLAAFNCACQPWYDRVVAGRRESRALTSLRDTLLPKLVSGELRLKDAERIAERATA